MSYFELLENHVPDKYLPFIKKQSSVKIHTSVDVGIASYCGEEDVQHTTYEYNSKTLPNTIILPALINNNNKGKLSQISVIIHY